MILQKINAVIPLLGNDGNYWIGARDIDNNNRHVWIDNGNHLGNDSSLWGGGDPSHGNADCVRLRKGDAKLYDWTCGVGWQFICEA